MEPKDTQAYRGLKRQKVLLSVLAVCALLLIVMLGGEVGFEHNRLKTLDQIDSLSNIVLRKHRLGNTRRKVTSTDVDTIFVRKTTRIGVPMRFSKTLFHLELAQTLQEWDVEAPARVYLPENELHIHLTYKNTIVRSLELYNDSSAVLSSFGGHVLLTSDYTTSPDLLSYRSLFAEPIPHVVQFENIRDLESYAQSHPLNSSHFLWITGENGGLGQPNLGKTELNRITKLLEMPKLLIFSDVNNPISGRFLELLENNGIEVFLITNFWIADRNAGLNEVEAIFDRYMADAKSDRRPTLVIPLKEMSLELLRKKLPAFKQQGFLVTAPSGI